MKKKVIITFLAILCLLLVSPPEAFCQKKGGPPPWAPAHGYRAKTRHVYFPDQNFYFDLQQGMYIYLNNGKWVVAAKLPSFFGSFNLTTARKIELDLSSDTPQRYNGDHVVKYKVKHKASGKGANGNNKGKGKGKGR